MIYNLNVQHFEIIIILRHKSLLYSLTIAHKNCIYELYSSEVNENLSRCTHSKYFAANQHIYNNSIKY